MTKKMTYNFEEIVYIEYSEKNIPFSVLTACDKGFITGYDFEFVYGDKRDIRFRQTSSGGHKTKIQPGGIQFWIAPGAKFKGRKHNSRESLVKPLRVRGIFKSSINPFNAAIESSYHFDYCKECDQWTCDGEGCSEHQHWDDEQSSLVYYKDNSLVE